MTEVAARGAIANARHLKPYPAYKPSGVEWLGAIPAHWEVVRADAFLRHEKIHVDPSSIRDELVFHYSIPSIQKTEDGALESPSEIGSAKLTLRGQRVLVSKLNPRKGLVLVACEKDVPTICSTEFVPLEVRGHEIRWALYLFLAEPTRQRISAVVRSATRSHQRAESAEITKIWHGVPPEPEQRAIAAFLDRETARIDALVAKKERLIELLQEKRTALVSRAVTKGLDSTVPMKDSGVEWLGEIPAHWEVKRLRHVGEAIIGLTYEPDDVVGPEEGVLVLRASNVRDGRVVYEDNVFVRTAIPEHLRTRLGDILICARSGSRDLIGKNARIDEGAVRVSFGAFMAVFRSSWNAFLSCVFDSALFEYQSGTFLTSTINQLTVGNLKDMTVPVPPGQEQATVAAFLDRETARIDALVARVGEAIERLKELRTALISAAVTGKIDVREDAA